VNHQNKFEEEGSGAMVKKKRKKKKKTSHRQRKPMGKLIINMCDLPRDFQSKLSVAHSLSTFPASRPEHLSFFTSLLILEVCSGIKIAAAGSLLVNQR
jgi:hypothetical protein